MATKVILVLIIVVLFFSGLTYIQFRQIQDLKTRNEELIMVSNDSARQAETYRNKYNEMVSKNEVLTIDLRDARKLEEFKKGTKGFNGVRNKIKNVTQVTKIEANIETKIPFTSGALTINSGAFGDSVQHAIDTDTTSIKLLDDGYNLIAIEPSGGLEVSISVPITGVVLWERSHKFWFIRFGKKKYFSEFKSDNPLVEITNSEVIQVRKK